MFLLLKTIKEEIKIINIKNPALPVENMRLESKSIKTKNLTRKKLRLDLIFIKDQERKKIPQASKGKFIQKNVVKWKPRDNSPFLEQSFPIRFKRVRDFLKRRRSHLAWELIALKDF